MCYSDDRDMTSSVVIPHRPIPILCRRTSSCSIQGVKRAAAQIKPNRRYDVVRLEDPNVQFQYAFAIQNCFSALSPDENSTWDHFRDAHQEVAETVLGIDATHDMNGSLTKHVRCWSRNVKQDCATMWRNTKSLTRAARNQHDVTSNAGLMIKPLLVKSLSNAELPEMHSQISDSYGQPAR